jgi:hypothetical protein
MQYYSKLLALAALICAVGFAQLSAQERPGLPDGVIHVALPPGAVRLEKIDRKGKPLLRVSVGKTVIEARNIFLGDFKGATEYEATKDGVHWVRPGGKEGPVFGGVQTHEPGSEIAVQDYVKVENLKAGSLFITTPTVKFLWGADAKPKGNS